MTHLKALVVILAVLVCLSVANAETVYFLVAEANNPAHSDSYVLPLTGPNDIAHARDLIKYGTAAGDSKVVAEIDCNVDCINRDYLSNEKWPWRWHVTEIEGFADIVLEILNGWPGLVDSDCQGWVSDTGGLIGFWTYTVVAELGTDPNHWYRDRDGDRDVDFEDYARAANTSFDLNDLEVFAEAWLSPYAKRPKDYSLSFDCWNCPYQCYGDADCNTEKYGVKTVRIGDKDLTILMDAMSKGEYDPCADFDRDFDVDEDDQAILTANWHKKDSDFGELCPTAPSCLVD